MSENINLEEAFKSWFEDNDIGDYEMTKRAFMAGARIIAHDTVQTLRDYGTAVAGLPAENITPTQGYDRAALNLSVYYAQILNKEQLCKNKP